MCLLSNVGTALENFGTAITYSPILPPAVRGAGASFSYIGNYFTTVSDVDPSGDPYDYETAIRSAAGIAAGIAAEGYALPAALALVYYGRYP